MIDMKEVEILIVEDNDTDAELTLRALKKNRLTNKIFLVKDGAEAIDFLFALGQYAERKNSNTPKLILLDLKLPKVDGIEVLRKIKSDERTQPIPVVMLTSSHEESDVVRSYRLGVNSYIVKPVDFDKFVDTVAQVGLYWSLMNKIPG